VTHFTTGGALLARYRPFSALSRNSWAHGTAAITTKENIISMENDLRSALPKQEQRERQIRLSSVLFEPFASQHCTVSSEL